MIELIGTVGSLAFALSGIPAAYAAFKDGYCTYPVPFLVLWGFAEALMIMYAIATGQSLLLLNYIPNAICLSVVGFYNRA